MILNFSREGSRGRGPASLSRRAHGRGRRPEAVSGRLWRCPLPREEGVRWTVLEVTFSLVSLTFRSGSCGSDMTPSFCRCCEGSKVLRPSCASECDFKVLS